MTSPPPHENDLDDVLREFFRREMPAELRTTVDSERVVAVRRDVRHAKHTRRPGRRAVLRSLLLAAAVVAGLMIAVTIGWRGDEPMMSRPVAGETPTEIPAEVPLPPAATSGSNRQDEPHEGLAAHGGSQERVPPVVAPRPELPHSVVANDPGTNRRQATFVGHEREWQQPQTVATDFGPVEQQVSIRWRKFTIAGEMPGSRVEYAVPDSFTIELSPRSPLDADRHAVVASLLAAPPVEAPRPVRDDAGTYLGIFTRTPAPLSEDQPFAPLGGARGLMVTAVLEDSPAQRAGLRPGDLIVACDGEPLDSVERLREVIAAIAADTTVRLDLIRDAKRDAVMATLASRAETFSTVRHDESFPTAAAMYEDGMLRFDASGTADDRAAGHDESASTIVRLLPIDGVRYHLEVVSSSSADFGPLLAGSVDELAAALPATSLAEGTRRQVEKMIRRIGETSSEGRWLCELTPRPRPDGLRLHVAFLWHDDAGRLHQIECDVPAEANRSDNVQSLLDVSLLAAELERLPAPAGGLFAAALRNLRAPSPTRRVEYAL